MAELKLSRLPNRTPVKLTLTLAPDLLEALDDYRLIYNRQYQVDAPLADLAAHMLAAFLAGDRGFAKARDALNRDGRADV